MERTNLEGTPTSKTISLCLSGGGFRATIFHLGVIDYLLQADLLRNVDSVYGVSGGAITAAHLAYCWEKYSDDKLYPRTARTLLECCQKGILDQVIWSSLILQRNRSVQMASELRCLFESTIPSSAPKTYLVCSSLTDTSQFAVELTSRLLYQLTPKHDDVRQLGHVGKELTPSIAVAMSACFPLAFEPVTLDTRLTSLDVKALGRDHTVADGGVVDNLGITIAHLIERNKDPRRLFLVSDAGRMFDDLDSQDAERATMLSPMRTIDYLLNQNAASILARVEPAIKARGSELQVIKLEKAREAVGNLQIDAALVKAAMDLRTNFDSFSFAEIVTTYRLGIISAERILAGFTEGVRSIRQDGLIASERLNGKPLNIPWGEVQIKRTPGVFGKVIETVLRKPGLAILAAGVLLFGAAVVSGIVARAALQF